MVFLRYPTSRPRRALSLTAVCESGTLGCMGRITDSPIDGHTPIMLPYTGTYRMACDCGWKETNDRGHAKFRTRTPDPECVSVRAIETWFGHVVEYGPHVTVDVLFEQLRMEVA